MRLGRRRAGLIGRPNGSKAHAVELKAKAVLIAVYQFGCETPAELDMEGSHALARFVKRRQRDAVKEPETGVSVPARASRFSTREGLKGRQRTRCGGAEIAAGALGVRFGSTRRSASIWSEFL